MLLTDTQPVDGFKRKLEALDEGPPAPHQRGDYDLAYVLLHNDAGGPTAAAAVINASTLREALPGMATTFAELSERFRDDRAQGPRAYAQESLKVTPDEDAALLAADAAAAVREFLAALDR